MIPGYDWVLVNVLYQWEQFMWNKIIMKQDRFVGNFVFDLSKWTTRYIFLDLKK